jgi:hypothetical protein
MDPVLKLGVGYHTSVVFLGDMLQGGVNFLDVKGMQGGD